MRVEREDDQMKGRGGGGDTEIATLLERDEKTKKGYKVQMRLKKASSVPEFT